MTTHTKAKVDQGRRAFLEWMRGFEDDDMTHKENARLQLKKILKENPGASKEKIRKLCRTENPFKDESATAYKAYCDVMREYINGPKPAEQKQGFEGQLKLW